MKRIVSVVLVFGVMFSHAQLIDNRNCSAFTDDNFFYQQFVEQNKIKSITGNISTKGEMKAIKDEHLVLSYEFDSLGRLIKQYGSFNRTGIKDTTFVTYLYDEFNRIITKRTNDAYGFYSYNFDYDTTGNILTKTYCRDENANISRNEFKLGKQYTIVKESYKYEENDSVKTKHVFNNHGRIYQREYYKYNKLGYLEEVTKKLVVNHKKSKVIFRYNELGKVSEKIIQNNTSSDDFVKYEYTYDELGNLTFIDEYSNDTKKYHKEVLYDQSTMLMKALLIQDVEANFITIIKFSYEFYE